MMHLTGRDEYRNFSIIICLVKKGLINVYVMRDLKENNNIELGFDRSKFLKIMLKTLFSLSVQLVKAILS